MTSTPASRGLLARLGIAHPIIQAPLAGGGDTPALAAAVSQAGGLGFLGAAYLSPQQIVAAAAEVRARTDRPFGINLFAPLPPPDPVDPAASLAAVGPFFDELGLPRPSAPQSEPDGFADQLETVLECGAKVFSFTMGALARETVARIKERDLTVIGTASTVAEALQLEASGVDAVVAQGAEAGGHRCTFLGAMEQGLVGTMALVPQTADAVSIPVIASGGIMDGRGIAAALALGADAVQMGTAFLACAESGVPAAYRDAIFSAREDQTRLTRAFSGRFARGIVNRFMSEIDAQASRNPDAILPFPRQNTLTRPLRAAGARAGQADVLSLWAGQGVRLARRSTAGALIEHLVRETASAASAVRIVAGSGDANLRENEGS